jgi:hypothetical protein
MRRVWALGIATAGLAAACALAELPPPPGTVPVQLEVSNKSPRPVGLSVEVQGRPLPNSAQPPSLPPNTAQDVTFYVPFGADWNLSVGGQYALGSPELRGRTGEIVDIGIEVDQRGQLSWWCSGRC